MRFVCILCALFTYSVTSAQVHNLTGYIFDPTAKPVEYATVALLQPEDSTLAFFGITDATGAFTIKSVKDGTYRLQISFIGFETYDTLRTIPNAAGDNLGVFVLRLQEVGLEGVKIQAERIPIQFIGDTLQYNADSYKTSPDASAEDLLKKLPGVEVDASGNVKAQGEDVQQVLVDGKEFFSNDPSVATKNLPADAIEKVQVFDRTSEEADFTGVDDGQRSKTINLVLKDGKKSMWLGNAQAGYGTDDRYQLNAKAYRFTKTNQIAALGMLNNINQFGFSINDYIDFNGGFGNMMRSGGFRIETGGDVPVNFGQSVDGQITSGATGLNYTYEPGDQLRFNVSYMGNGYERNLIQSSNTINYTPTGTFETDADLDENTLAWYHKLNLNVRSNPDSLQRIIVSGNAGFNSAKTTTASSSGTYFDEWLSNQLMSDAYTADQNFSATGNVTYIHKLQGAVKFWKVQAYGNGGKNLTNASWLNLTDYFDTDIHVIDTTDRNDDASSYDGTLALSTLIKIGGNYYLEPSLTAGLASEKLQRLQYNAETSALVDSLSTDVSRFNNRFTPGLAIKRNTTSTQFTAGFSSEIIQMHNTFSDADLPVRSFVYILPEILFEREVKRGMRFGFDYMSAVNAPTVNQLNPTTDYSNPLVLYNGNPFLKPEYQHTLEGRFMFFDQFSFTSLFTRAAFTYTIDKINYSKTILSDLTQTYTLVNVQDDIEATGGFHFNTPIRPLFVNLGLSFDETYNKGINLINEEKNTIQAFTHDVELSFDNRKKEIVDARIGGSVQYTQTQYSIATDQNADYIMQSLFADVSVTPDSLWRLEMDADIQMYRIIGDDTYTIVPMLSVELSRYFLKYNRGTITLKAYDILNRNTGITQSTAFNYLSTQESNTMNRYFMLSFKYRINKQDQKGGVEVKVN